MNNRYFRILLSNCFTKLKYHEQHSKRYYFSSNQRNEKLQGFIGRLDHKLIFATCGITCGALIVYNNFNTIQAAKIKSDKENTEEEFGKTLKLTSRERHFINFASAEHDGQIYMTPQDFLESLIIEEARPRLKRRVVTPKEIEDIKHTTPTLKKGSTKLFRSLRDRGLISYTEYLFLLSVLTKPQTGFVIAFNMFDTDGNKRVDKEEFLVIMHLLSAEVKSRAEVSDEMRIAQSKLVNLSQQKSVIKKDQRGFMEKIFSHAWSDKHGEKGQEESSDAESGTNTVNGRENKDGERLMRRNPIDTTLLVHFFGKKGNVTLQYEDFRRFMDNLQTEVLEMEFQEFAKGATSISEIDFAKILLRYTHLDPKAYELYLDRLLTALKDQQECPPGIGFTDFKIFCQFLNNLEDFTIAMRMYTLADHPISKDEFHRAVKICTGTFLSPHLVHTVFTIFDEDGDGQLSYREFIAIMKDRLHRGFKSHIKVEGWDGFKNCIKQEMRNPN